MKALVEGSGRLVWDDVNDPSVGPCDVLIRVHATAVNRADLIQRAGHYPPPPGASPLLGLECAGVVARVGAEVSRFREGDAVCALLTGGGYASYVSTPASSVLPVPDGLSTVDAASIPEVWATAWLNLIQEAKLVSGERALIHAAGSGVGTAAVQLLTQRGVRCFVTAGSDAKIARCLGLGAASGHNRMQGSFLPAVRAWSPDGVDAILDPVGADYLSDNVRVLRRGGRLVIIGLLSGRKAPIDLGRLLTRRLRVIGSVLRSRTEQERSHVVQGLLDEVWPLLASKAVTPVIDAVYPVARADEAHQRLRDNLNFGKVLLKMPDC